MKRSSCCLALLLLATSAFPIASQAEVRGDAKAVARVDGMLERIGGRKPWAAVRTLYVKEHAFLRDGSVATVEIWRDFDALTRRIVTNSSTLRRVTVVGESSGWAERDGKVTRLAEPEFAKEKQGLAQEPYHIYHRLAKGDAKLQVELDGTDKLEVHDQDHGLLCWFVLDEKDNPISWANFYDGAITQHWYGPLQKFGPINLPKWGSAADGRWRFEYVEASMSADRLELSAAPG